MTRLSDIPIRVDSSGDRAAQPSGGSPAALAILHEVEALLARYQAYGHQGSVDLRWMSLMPGDLDWLREVLGTGEVRAEISALGVSTVCETAIQCVWWVEHRGPVGEALGQSIDICEVPSLLHSDRAAIAYGLEALRDRIESFGIRPQ